MKTFLNWYFMHPILVYLVVSFIAFAIGYIILKIIFGKSLLFRVSILTVTAMYVACFLTFYSGVNGIRNLIWAVPTMAVYSLVIFIAINKIRKRLEKLTHQLQELSQGSLKIELAPSSSDDETGRLNNTIIHLLESFKKMHNEFDISAANLVVAGQQTLNASAHLSNSSYDQAFSIDNIKTEIEHLQAKIQGQKQICSESNNGIHESLNTMNVILKMNQELEEKINQINELASGYTIIKAELVAELIMPAMELTRRTVTIMKESASRINRMSEMINEAYCLSKEQSTSMDAISGNMGKLDIMAQQNALYSVELTACSELLKEEAEKLKSSTSVFGRDD